MKNLTSRQNQVLSWIRESVEKTGQAPTVRELQQKIGCSAPMGVVSHLAALENKGYINRIEGKARGIIITSDDEKKREEIVQVPIVGNVACGKPIWAEEMIEEIIPLPRSVNRYNRDVFILRAKGDSMNLAGIDNKDLVIFHKQNYAENGDKVVALIGAEATVKKMKMEGKMIKFLPVSNNPIHQEIMPEEGTFMIQGKVIGVIKSNI